MGCFGASVPEDFDLVGSAKEYYFLGFEDLENFPLSDSMGRLIGLLVSDFDHVHY